MAKGTGNCDEHFKIFLDAIKSKIESAEQKRKPI